MKITIGRTVLYVLSDEDAKQINRRRTDSGSISDRIKLEKWPLGAQAHIGNPVGAGDIRPAVAVRVFGEGDKPPVNLQVLLDGNDVYWATSRAEDAAKTQGTWHWPDRV
jgi:hypothetical protein